MNISVNPEKQTVYLSNIGYVPFESIKEVIKLYFPWIVRPYIIKQTMSGSVMQMTIDWNGVFNNKAIMYSVIAKLDAK